MTNAPLPAAPGASSVARSLMPVMAAVFVVFLITGAALPALPLYISDDLGFGPFVVGIVAGAQFAAALVSRVHCRLIAHPGGELEVRDLDSTNGTFVNGTRVQTARLASGDRLQIGRVELVALRDND